jgi:hypothetical protein
LNLFCSSLSQYPECIHFLADNADQRCLHTKVFWKQFKPLAKVVQWWRWCEAPILSDQREVSNGTTRIQYHGSLPPYERKVPITPPKILQNTELLNGLPFSCCCCNNIWCQGVHCSLNWCVEAARQKVCYWK